MAQKHYTEEFKQEAVRIALSKEKLKAQTAREIGISENTLYAWIKGLNPSSQSDATALSPDEHTELIRMCRELKRVQEERDIYKNAGYLLGELRLRYQFIRNNRTQFRIASLCRVLRVTRSGYYACYKRPESNHAKEDCRLLNAIAVIYQESHKTYGSPRIYQALHSRGEKCGENHVARLMRAHNIAACRKRKYRVTTNSEHNLPVTPNLLNRQFEVAEPNRVWLSDITYIATGEGWLYLVAVLDLASRQIISWSMDTMIKSRLAITALNATIKQRHPEAYLIHHSDRGSQHASSTYQKSAAR